MNSPIRFDVSDRSVVIVCDDCPWWQALRLTLREARECAADHERQQHPGLDVHQAARRQRIVYARRHADAVP